MDQVFDLTISTGSPVPATPEKIGERVSAKPETRSPDDAVAISLSTQAETESKPEVVAALPNIKVLSAPKPATQSPFVEATYTAIAHGELVAQKIALDFQVGYSSLDETKPEESGETKRQKAVEAYVTAFHGTETKATELTAA